MLHKFKAFFVWFECVFCPSVWVETDSIRMVWLVDHQMCWCVEQATYSHFIAIHILAPPLRFRFVCSIQINAMAFTALNWFRQCEKLIVDLYTRSVVCCCFFLHINYIVFNISCPNQNAGIQSKLTLQTNWCSDFSISIGVERHSL